MIFSPFLLAAVLKHHFENAKPSVAQDLLRNLYVGNVIVTTNEKSKTRLWYPEIKRIFMEPHVNFREFVTNDPNIRDTIDEKDWREGEVTWVHGMYWIPRKDGIALKISSCLG